MSQLLPLPPIPRPAARMRDRDDLDILFATGSEDDGIRESVQREMPVIADQHRPAIGMLTDGQNRRAHRCHESFGGPSGSPFIPAHGTPVFLGGKAID